MIYFLKLHTGNYYVEGIGYAAIEDVLRDFLVRPWFLWLLVALKLLTPGLTLGSGGSGGVFSPSLFIGAAMGCAFAELVHTFLPGLAVDPASFAVVGMAGMVAGATGAVVTAVTMLFEMTRDYSVILPVMLAVGIAYAVRKRVCNASIYTLKLLRRGHVVPEGLRSALDEAHEARHFMARRFCVVQLDDPASMEGIKTECPDPHAVLVVVQQGNVNGLVAFWPAGQPVTERDLKIHARSDFIVVPEYTRLPDLLRAMKSAEDVEKKVAEASAAIKTCAVDQRAEAVQRAEGVLTDIDARIDQLESRVQQKWGQMDQAARQQAATDLAALRKERTQAAEWYGGLKHGSSQAWSVRLRGGCRSRFQEVSHSGLRWVIAREKRFLAYRQRPSHKFYSKVTGHDLRQWLKEEHLVLSGQANLDNIVFLKQQIGRLEEAIQKQVKLSDAFNCLRQP